MNHAPKALTFAREKAGLTKRALAKQCGISEQLLCDIEAGRRNATPANLIKFASALNCPVVSLEAARDGAPSGADIRQGWEAEGAERPNSPPRVASSYPPTGARPAA